MKTPHHYLEWHSGDDHLITTQCSTPAGSLIIDDISKSAKRVCVCIGR